jgi:hypothetical protein
MLLSFFLLIIPVQLVFTNNGVDGLIYLQLGYLVHFFLGLLPYVYIKRLQLYLTYPTQQGSFQVSLLPMNSMPNTKPSPLICKKTTIQCFPI